jgi:hypothetical protein
VLKKLIELGVVPVQIPEEEKTRLLDHLEAMVGVLPDAYRLMLSHFGGDLQFSSLVCFRADIPSPWACGEGKDALDILYGLTSKYEVSASEMFDIYIGRIPDGWVPNGASAGGNQICLHTGNKERQSVGFWDHESELRPGLPARGGGITLIAPSLADFIDGLTPDQDSGNVLNQVRVNLRF